MIVIKTKDADEAAFFWTQKGVQLSGTQCKYGYSKKILWFIFDADMTQEEFDVLHNDYRNGKTLVEPKTYASKRSEVKNLIRENIFA